MTDSFEGKVAIVTGAGYGLGRASAIAFARNGAKVIVNDINIERGQETTQIINTFGGSACFIKADVTKAVEVETLVNKTVQIYGRLDYAHNNIGMGEHISLIDGTEELWDQMIDANLKSVWLCMKYELMHMTRHGGGAIVNTSAIAGVKASPISPFFAAGKWGVIGLTKSAALVYIKEGVRINAICPSGMEGTGMHERNIADPAWTAMRLKNSPMGRFATVEEVAEVVVWLCSDAASFVNAHAMVVDAGMSA